MPDRTSRLGGLQQPLCLGGCWRSVFRLFFSFFFLLAFSYSAAASHFSSNVWRVKLWMVWLRLWAFCPDRWKWSMGHRAGSVLSFPFGREREASGRKRESCPLAERRLGDGERE